MSAKLQCTVIAKWYKYAKRVRYCCTPQNTQTINEYLESGQNVIRKYSTDSAHDVYLTEYNVLLETMCDTLIPTDWRQLCSDNITRVLIRLRALAYTKEEILKTQILSKEHKTLEKYFVK